MSADVTERPPRSDTYERTPPFDEDAERCVLGGMMLSKDAVADVIEIVKAVDFYQPRHAVIFTAITEMYADNEPTDPIAVANRLTREGSIVKAGGAPYLHTCLSTIPTAANAPYYAGIVADTAILRRVIEGGTRVVQLGYAANGTGREVMDRAQQLMFDLDANMRQGGAGLLAELMQPTLDEIEAAGAAEGRLRGLPTGFADLDRLLNGLRDSQLVLVGGRPAQGKALALDTRLATPSGWTTMGNVQVGDQLIGSDGRPTAVVAATEVMAGRPCYRLTFNDGSVLVADSDHQWITSTRAERRAKRGSRSIRTTKEIAATLRCLTADQRLNHTIANCAPLQLPEAELPIAPYTLGAWLGDGHSAAARVTSADPQVIELIQADGYITRIVTPVTYSVLLPRSPRRTGPATCAVCGATFEPKSLVAQTCGRSCGGRWKPRPSPPPPTCVTCGGPMQSADVNTARQCGQCHREHGTLQARLRGLGVLGDKHIPDLYLRASERQRRALLAGLMDTDGTACSDGTVQLVLTNRRLAEGARELVNSLGYRCALRTRQVRGRTAESSTAYILTFTALDEVFQLDRKRAAHRERQTTKGERTGYRQIVSVELIPSVPVRCVEVDSVDHTYLAGATMIPTHNSTLGVDVARINAIKHNHPVAFFSLEMTQTEIVTRILSAEARIPLNTLLSGDLTDADWTKLARRMGEISAAPLFIDDCAPATLTEIRAKARRLKQLHDIKLIVIDHFHLLSPAKKYGSDQEMYSDLSRQVKLLAKELRIPVLCLVQLNRNSEGRGDKTPQLSDLRGTGSLEQDADVVILVHRDDYYDKESPRAGEGDFIVAKHRNGPTDTITVAAQLHLSRFVDMAI